MDIQETSNQELKDLYIECKILMNTLDKTETDEELLLDKYNSLFDTSFGILHISMAEQLFNVVRNEMAERFANQK